MNALFLFVRRLISISLFLFVLLLLTMIPQYLEPIDVVSLLILAVFVSTSALIAYKSWPRKSVVKSVVKSVIPSESDSHILVDPVFESLSIQPAENVSNAPIPHNEDSSDQLNAVNVEEMNYMSSEDKKNNTPSSNSDNEKISDFRIFSSFAVGTKYDGRKQQLKELINHLKDIEFYEFYEGLSNSEILDDYPIRDESNPVWEMTDEILPFATIRSEPDNPYDKNAVAVFVGESESYTFKVGYLPKEDAERITPILMKSNNFYVTAYIKGGKRKFIEYDDYGDEKVRTRTKDYLLDLKIVFL